MVDILLKNKIGVEGILNGCGIVINYCRKLVYDYFNCYICNY